MKNFVSKYLFYFEKYCNRNRTIIGYKVGKTMDAGTENSYSGGSALSTNLHFA